MYPCAKGDNEGFRKDQSTIGEIVSDEMSFVGIKRKICRNGYDEEMSRNAVLSDSQKSAHGLCPTRRWVSGGERKME